ncbi:ATP-binding cassette domain-containing protein [Nonomuraea salmonea]|uniref:ATP-binding cassette domain-containing protein n=1 Tax=Nonomuraea salmonea TaxID=46181 RepID=UPI0031E8BD51
MIELHRVTKTYNGVKALDDVSFTVHPGSVTGFLGPNGAGKSTAMRILAGLARPTSGRATVLGKPYAELARPGYDVGTLLDAGAQHPGRTGREVLTLGALMLGLPKSRVDEVLDLVGLTGKEAGRPIRGYSLGMRQRLGIGHALLGRPRALILDEPANGLDPPGHPVDARAPARPGRLRLRRSAQLPPAVRGGAGRRPHRDDRRRTRPGRRHPRRAQPRPHPRTNLPRPHFPNLPHPPPDPLTTHHPPPHSGLTCAQNSRLTTAPASDSPSELETHHRVDV